MMAFFFIICRWYSFNSTLVRLNVLLLLFLPPPSFCFNSTLVRLNDHLYDDEELHNRSFNSTLVRLNACTDILKPPLQISFNSTLVRLNDRCKQWNNNLAASCSDNWFQFHSGTIKCSTRYQCWKTSILFQFHSGTIKCPTNRTYTALDACFNSTLVRLNGWNFWAVLWIEVVSIPLWYD